jgi:hypothetical protein
LKVLRHMAKTYMGQYLGALHEHGFTTMEVSSMFKFDV